MPKQKFVVADQLPASLVTWKFKLPSLGCGNPLVFTMQHQQQTEWCWAANAVSVNLYYHPASGWAQCDLVNSALGETECCTNASSANCNQGWYVDRALQIVGNFNRWTGNKATFAAVQTEINGCRPLCLRIGWNGGGGHFVAIYGYSSNNINVGDPWYGNSVVNYASFPNGYNGGGSWTHSYFTKP
jgi:hypothetical protein